jgi:hypothetical protein
VWNWAEHNPGLAIVSSVAIIGVTEPIVLSEAAIIKSSFLCISCLKKLLLSVLFSSSTLSSVIKKS